MVILGDKQNKTVYRRQPRNASMLVKRKNAPGRLVHSKSYKLVKEFNLKCDLIVNLYTLTQSSLVVGLTTVDMTNQINVFTFNYWHCLRAPLADITGISQRCICIGNLLICLHYMPCFTYVCRLDN